MSYPFTKAPTSTEFMEIAVREFGCEELRPKNVVGPRGEEHMVCLTRRLPSGAILYSQVLPSDLEERLLPPMVERLCRQLDIPPARFDLVLH